MGCDIHCWREQRVDGVWQATDKATFNAHEDADADYATNPEADQGYPNMTDFGGGRDYGWFGFITGGAVRWRCPYGFAEPKGIPDDLSPEVKALMDHWDGDGHNHSWLSLRELKEKAALILLEPLPHDEAWLGEKLRRIISELDVPGVDPEDLRMVFCFDN